MPHPRSLILSAPLTTGWRGSRKTTGTISRWDSFWGFLCTSPSACILLLNDTSRTDLKDRGMQQCMLSLEAVHRLGIIALVSAQS